MRDLTQGRPFVGQFTSADASALSEANARFTLYDAAKAPAAITLQADERVVITDITARCDGNGQTVELYDGADASIGAGERITILRFGTNVPQHHLHLGTPHYCAANESTVTPKGYPKVVTSGVSQVDVTIRGVIIKV